MAGMRSAFRRCVTNLIVSPGSSRVVSAHAFGKLQYGCPLTSHFSFHGAKSFMPLSSVGDCIHCSTWVMVTK